MTFKCLCKGIINLNPGHKSPSHSNNARRSQGPVKHDPPQTLCNDRRGVCVRSHNDRGVLSADQHPNGGGGVPVRLVTLSKVMFFAAVIMGLAEGQNRRQ